MYPTLLVLPRSLFSKYDESCKRDQCDDKQPSPTEFENPPLLYFRMGVPECFPCYEPFRSAPESESEEKKTYILTNHNLSLNPLFHRHHCRHFQCSNPHTLGTHRQEKKWQRANVRSTKKSPTPTTLLPPSSTP